ncbi:methyltransferase regulatory domain-containing protein [Conchiformibius kuhniae]|uniref:Methyltransferase regulatory domain-containing protein n=1 Tax=Conchiformibius kuhniae TaxID=211502 RepID=A0A8T9MRJ6_9NEIS|nr:methyltransferase regulatory domain-containing protein [Conchiformibius kuhniae]UOP04207.1 methyltransferase regulatory domain-containing protein [Conchiformibius kuhniae]
MSAWSYGYVSNVGYTYGYYHELNPLRAIVPMLQEGLAVPEIKNACELGFGQGVSLNAHAAAQQIRWYGTDFNPAHAAFARDLASTCGSNALITDQDFASFCSRDDLPEFEFIGLHGIWSWISDDNRRIIADFVRRKLAVGGILYISYNTLPGWSAHAPIRHLLAMHDNVRSVGGQSHEQNVQNALAFGSRVLAQSPLVQHNAPNIAKRLDEIAKQNTNYLAHEYLNRDWHPMYYADLAQWLEPAKVGFACSANYLDDFNLCLYTAEQQKLMDEVAGTPLAQTVKDFLLNKQFRRDLWVKGARRLNNVQLAQQRGKQRFVLTVPRESVELSVSNHVTVGLMPEVFEPVLEILSDHQVHRTADITQALAGKANPAQVFAALTILHAKHQVAQVQDEVSVEAARGRCRAFNESVIAAAHNNGEIYYLTSPLSGGAVSVSRIDLLFAEAHNHGLREPQQWAAHTWQILQAQGQAMLNKDGEALTTEADNLAELTRLAEEFAKQRLIALKALQILTE